MQDNVTKCVSMRPVLKPLILVMAKDAKDMNGMLKIAKLIHTTRQVLVLDNNSYFLDAVKIWAGQNGIIVRATSNSDDFFYQLAGFVE